MAGSAERRKSLRYRLLGKGNFPGFPEDFRLRSRKKVVGFIQRGEGEARGLALPREGGVCERKDGGNGRNHAGRREGRPYHSS